MDSYDIRFWDIKKLGNGTGARFRVRWAVDGHEHCKSFKARPLADGFLTELKDAVRDRRPFNPKTGLPDVEVSEDEVITWYQHSRAYTEVKWANLAPVSRRSVAEALVTVTIALGYAVELGLLGSNPVDRIQWTAPAVAPSVDRRVVVTPPRPRCS